MKYIRLLFFSLIMLAACQQEAKKELDPQPSSVGRTDIRQLRESFLAQGYEKKLYQSINDTISLYWEPQWEAATKRIEADSSSTFIPLRPKWESKKSGHSPSSFDFIGTRKFLLVKRKKEALDFFLVTYLFHAREGSKDDPAAKLNPQTKRIRLGGVYS